MSGNTAKNIQLKGMSQLFKSNTVAEPPEPGVEKIVMMPLNQLHPHPDNPYSVKHDAEMTELVDLIRESGQQEAIIARPRPAGGYEVISGHRRLEALGVLGIEAKVVVRNMSDDEAIIALVDANAKRKNISPMEQSKAYEMRINAVSRKRGRPVVDIEKDVRSGHDKEKGSARKQVAKDMGVSESTIQRYTALKNLTPELQKMTDDGKLGVPQASGLAQLSPADQKTVYGFMDINEITKPSKLQVGQLKLLSEEGAVTDRKLKEVFKPKMEKNNDRKITFDNSILDKYFPPELTPKEIENILVGFLEKYKNMQLSAKKSEPSK